MSNLTGRTATGSSERVDLFASALHELVTSEGGFVIFGCPENADIYIQFAWGPPVLVFEASGAGAGPTLTDYLTARGFAAPDGAQLNFSRELGNPEPGALAAQVDELFVHGFACAADYTARIDELEID